MVLNRVAIALVLGSLLASAACNLTFDVDRPIALVAPSWNDADREAVSRAVTCWNQQFGVPLTLDSSTTDQQVAIDFNELICIGGRTGGQFSPPDRIDVCPVELLQPRVFPFLENEAARADILFLVLIHELGHVVGILDHASDPDAVMGGNGALIDLANNDIGFVAIPAFSDQDRDLFEHANGSRTGSCTGNVVAVVDGQLATPELGILVKPVECSCQVECAPDEFEPNGITDPAAMLPATGTFELRTCDHDVDRFKVTAAAHVRIENEECDLTMSVFAAGNTSFMFFLTEADVMPGDTITVSERRIGVCNYRLVLE